MEEQQQQQQQRQLEQDVEELVERNSNIVHAA